jgi:hypothetical protein
MNASSLRGTWLRIGTILRLPVTMETEIHTLSVILIMCVTMTGDTNVRLHGKVLRSQLFVFLLVLHTLQDL